MLQAVADALHLPGANAHVHANEAAASLIAPHWSALTERDAQRFVAVGLELASSSVSAPAVAAPVATSAQAQRVQHQFCFQYIRPWEREPPVQVLRLREEVQAQSHSRSRSRDSSAIGTAAVAAAVVRPRAEDSKRRRRLLMALRSPLRVRSDNTAAPEHVDSPSDRQIAAVPEQSALSTTASPRCKVEVTTPTRSAVATEAAVQRAPVVSQQSQPLQGHQQPQQVLRTPEPIMTGKRKRVSVSISPPALPQVPRAPQSAAAMPSVRSASRWVSPKPERLLRQQQEEEEEVEEPHQPPLKTRRLSDNGAKTSATSRFALMLRDFFNEMCGNGSDADSPTDDVSGRESDAEDDPGDDASGRESGAESDPSETSSTSSGSNNVAGGDAEFGDCDQYGGNATLLADIQDALDPVWSLLETTSDRFQHSVVWRGEGVRDLSSSSVRIHPLTQKSIFDAQPSDVAGLVPTTTDLIFDGAEFEDENGETDWMSAIEKPDKLAVRTRRQCREMRQLSTAWRLW